MSEAQNLLAKAEEIEKQQQQQKESEQAVEQKKQQEYICPICRHPASRPVVQADEADLREFMRCIMGEKLFAKTYSIGSGKQDRMKWKLQILTSNQSDQMDALLAEISKQKERTGMQLMSEVQEVKLLFYVRAVNDEVFEPPGNECTEIDQIHKIFNERYGSKSELVKTIGVRVITTFEQLIAILTTAVFDESFWQGAGLV